MVTRCLNELKNGCLLAISPLIHNSGRLRLLMGINALAEHDSIVGVVPWFLCALCLARRGHNGTKTSGTVMVLCLDVVVGCCRGKHNSGTVAAT